VLLTEKLLYFLIDIFLKVGIIIAGGRCTTLF
jgi:hypothetical protein